MHSDRWEIVPIRVLCVFKSTGIDDARHIMQDIELSAEGLRHAFTVEDRDRERERESGTSFVCCPCCLWLICVADLHKLGNNLVEAC